MPKPLPEIVKCKRCGRIPELDTGKDCTVYCVKERRDGCLEYCWIGPVMKSTRGAINAWNSIMGGGK